MRLLWEKFKAELMRAKGDHLLRSSPRGWCVVPSGAEEEMAVTEWSGSARLVALLERFL